MTHGTDHWPQCRTAAEVKVSRWKHAASGKVAAAAHLDCCQKKVQGNTNQVVSDI